MKHILETERLRLREFNLNDTAFIITLLNSPGWLKYIGDRVVKTTEQAKQYLENGPLKSYTENGYGLSLVEKKDGHAAIGMCGILNRKALDTPDIGFAFLPGYCGQGYAFEVADAMLQYAHKTLNIPKISAITIPDNRSSIKLLEKLGLKFRKPFKFQNSEEELHLYSN
jgi:ribosomal-protein-alanine N-acetyltransferase